MTYSVPAHGEPNWDGKISPSLQYLKDTAEAAETPTGAQAKATAAQNAAISAAATDATNKANTAQANAIASAATDATTKANSVQSNLNTHVGNVANPHSVTKAQVGLGNVDNTSDVSKPVSTAQQTALDAKVAKSANLSDLTSASTARSNLGLGTAATSAATDFVSYFSVKSYGAVGDGTTNDTSAIASAISAAAASLSSTVGRAVVFFPRGTYLTDRFNVPARVSLVGESRSASVLKNRSTDGLVFVALNGSFSEVRSLRIDGQHAAQASLGVATVQFARSNNPTAGGTNISGGVVISAASAGATSITVNTASPGGVAIVAGEYISLVEGTTFELVQVAASYTSGTTIPLVNPLANAFTVAAKASVAVTGVGIFDCDVLGNGRDGIAFWHTIVGKAHHNRVSDFEDTGIDIPSAGSWWVDIGFNTIETKGRWGVAMDTAETEFGPVTECTSHDNVIRFQSGGSYTNGNTLDGIYLGNVVRCKSVNDNVNLVLAGLCGVNFAGNSYNARDCEVINLTVTGPPTIRANTSGIRVTISSANIRPKVIGGSISNVSNGVDLGTVRSAIVSATKVINVSGFAVNVTSDSGNVQLISVVGLVADTNTAGFRVGGTAAVGAKATVTGCILTNSSFAPVVSDVNWTITQTANIP